MAGGAATLAGWEASEVKSQNTLENQLWYPRPAREWLKAQKRNRIESRPV